MTPYETIFNKKLKIDYIKTLGSLTFVLNPKVKRINKFDDKALKRVLINFKSLNNDFNLKSILINIKIVYIK
jgi:hypothetical protein